MNDTEKLMWYEEEMGRRADLAESLGYTVDREEWICLGKREK